MTEESEHYTVDEAARILGISPARTRQMLRSGDLEGERGMSRVEGVLGPWRVSGRSVKDLRERREAAEAETVVSQDAAPLRDNPSDAGPSDAPSDASEHLSEGVGEIREKAEELLRQIERLEGRLETAEMQEITLRESLRREKEHSEALRAELEAERSRRGEEGRGGWRRLFGG